MVSLGCLSIGDCDWARQTVLRAPRIEAHGAGLLFSEVEKRWYWYGETEKTYYAETKKTPGANCYSAADLSGPWSYEGEVFGLDQIPPQSLDGGEVEVVKEAAGEGAPAIHLTVLERPKVLFNPNTNLYVLWFHLDDEKYKYRRAGVATSPTPTGPFRFVHAIQPDGEPSPDSRPFEEKGDRSVLEEKVGLG